MRGHARLRISLILFGAGRLAFWFALMAALVGCGTPVVQLSAVSVEASANHVPLEIPLGRLAVGGDVARFVLIGEGEQQTLEARLMWHESHAPDRVELVLRRWDAKSEDRRLIEPVSVEPALLRAEVPAPTAGAWIEAELEIWRGDDISKVGSLRLEVGDGLWELVELRPAMLDVLAHAVLTQNADEGLAMVPQAPVHTSTPVPSPLIAQPPVMPTAPTFPASVRIVKPLADESVIDAISVSGQAASPDGKVLVQILDVEGRVLAQQYVVLAGGAQRGTFEILMQFPPVDRSQYGFVHAVVENPNGSVGAETAVRVNLMGSAGRPTPLVVVTPTSVRPIIPAVRIGEPPAGVPLRDGVWVRGRAVTFDGKVFVSVREFTGQVLAEAVAIVKAAAGEEGEWEVRVEFPAPRLARQGRIEAHVRNLQNGAPAAQDSVVVWLAGR